MDKMKITLLLIGFILIGGLVYFFTNWKGKSKTREARQVDSDAAQVKTNVSEQNLYHPLRQMAFAMTPERLGVTDLKADNIYGVIMDWHLEEGIMTLVTYKTGDASMYLSTGGGVIGGGHHENVNKASKQFVKFGDGYLSMTARTDLTSAPENDCVRFYFLTATGKYYAEEKMVNFENNTSPWLEYFEEANKVISELRMTSEK